MSEENLSNPKDDILETARNIVRLGPICDNCLGRQFAMLSTGLTNAERGRSIKTVLAMQASAVEDRAVQEELAPSFRSARFKLGRKDEEDARCTVCLGEMAPQKLDDWAEKAAERSRAGRLKPWSWAQKCPAFSPRMRSSSRRMAAPLMPSPSSPSSIAKLAKGSP